MRANHQFPIYLVASRDGVIVITTGGKDCILLFHSQDLAWQTISRIHASHPRLGPLSALKVPDAQTLKDGLKELPRNITCAVWDPAGGSAGVQHVSISDLLQTIPN